MGMCYCVLYHFSISYVTGWFDARVCGTIFRTSSSGTLFPSVVGNMN